MKNTIKSNPCGDQSKYALIRNGIVEELDRDRLHSAGPFLLSPHNIGLLLEFGVLKSPDTVYEDLRVLNAGDYILYDNDKPECEYGSIFAFERDKSSNNSFDLGDFEQRLKSAIRSQVPSGSRILLFLSGGKDSAALACVVSAMRDEYEPVCITYQSKSQSEAEIASLICRKLNLPHKIVSVENFKVSNEVFINFFSSQILPSLDLCSTVYLHCNLEEYSGYIFMDGMGNDLYAGHIPPMSEYRAARLQQYIPGFVRKLLMESGSSSRLSRIASRSRDEMPGFWSFLSNSALVNELCSVEARIAYWKGVSPAPCSLDYIDLRASLRGRFIDQEKFIRKIKNAATTYGMDLSLPWTDKDLCDYVFHLKESDLFDRNKLINKLFIRRYLGHKLGIDYFKELKRTFSYDYDQFIDANIDVVMEVVGRFDLIDGSVLKKEVSKYYKRKNFGALYQLFLMAGWYAYSEAVDRS
jgi:asparagine synthase (glutamine-hydrolysing)